MEEYVIQIVDQICNEDEASDAPKYTTGPECRMDTACFVLNRIPQRYVSSARGQAHTEQSLSRNQQLFVDVVTLTHEGLRRVTSVQRSFYGEEPTSPDDVHGPRFYLPTIMGRLLNGVSFDLLVDTDVHLLANDEPVKMLDSRWQNPYRTVANTPGSYLFWPAPLAAEKAGVEKTFEFEIRVEDDRFDAFRHFFTISRTSTDQIPNALEMTSEHRIPDLYLLPRS
jgi:competence protein ComFB